MRIQDRLGNITQWVKLPNYVCCNTYLDSPPLSNTPITISPYHDASIHALASYAHITMHASTSASPHASLGQGQRAQETDLWDPNQVQREGSVPPSHTLGENLPIRFGCVILVLAYRPWMNLGGSVCRFTSPEGSVNPASVARLVVVMAGVFDPSRESEAKPHTLIPDGVELEDFNPCAYLHSVRDCNLVFGKLSSGLVVRCGSLFWVSLLAARAYNYFHRAKIVWEMGW